MAADFQQLQATAGAKRLSERNCIELVTRLIQMGQIDVVYTLDGKEYVTPKHLEKEIKNELLVHRGRQIIVLWSVMITVIDYAPISVLPHLPPYWQKVGTVILLKSMPQIRGI